MLVFPFTGKIENRLEIFNEFSILIISWHIPIFTNFVDNPNIQYYFGWTVIGFTTANIVINTLYAITIHLSAIVIFCKNRKF